MRAAIVVAHPDDETLGCGSLFSRIADLTIFHVTDGAPKSDDDAARHGFAKPAGYAAARRRELEMAVALAGLPADRLVSLGWSDQEASLHMVEIARDLAGQLAGTEVVLTHAFEGGHPDHDGTALSVHAAARAMDHPPAVLEFPLYRAAPDGGWAVQSFADPAEAAVLELTPAEQRQKQAMLAAFVTQGEVLARFSSDTECFRPAPAYDFCELPNGGELLYEIQYWGMTGSRWLELARPAMAQLDLEGRG
jgi:LmbE family N-acetylglucosaminyl deacetylase